MRITISQLRNCDAWLRVDNQLLITKTVAPNLTVSTTLRLHVLFIALKSLVCSLLGRDEITTLADLGGDVSRQD
jgi:hypothetical protein